MQKEIKKGQIITSLLVLQAIIEKDKVVSKSTGKQQTTSKFKYATTMNISKFMEVAKIINDVFVEKFSEFKTEFNDLAKKYEVLDETGTPKYKGNIPLYGLDVLSIPDFSDENANAFEEEYKVIREKHEGIFIEFNSLLEENTTIDITETASTELPDFLDYSDIEIIKFMIKG